MPRKILAGRPLFYETKPPKFERLGTVARLASLNPPVERMAWMPALIPARRDPYGVALDTLRRWTAERLFAPGEALVVTDLAERIGLSPTPVREALACLAGEGLIDRRKGRGYRYPADEAPTLLDLYGLQRAYVHSALTLYFAGPGGLQKCAPLAHRSLEPSHVFGAAVAQSGNGALIHAHKRVSSRLSEPDRADRSLDPDLGSLIEQMAVAMSEGLRERLLFLVERHYEARCARAWRVARSLEAGLSRP